MSTEQQAGMYGALIFFFVLGVVFIIQASRAKESSKSLANLVIGISLILFVITPNFLGVSAIANPTFFAILGVFRLLAGLVVSVLAVFALIKRHDGGLGIVRMGFAGLFAGMNVLVGISLLFLTLRLHEGPNRTFTSADKSYSVTLPSETWKSVPVPKHFDAAFGHPLPKSRVITKISPIANEATFNATVADYSFKFQNKHTEETFDPDPNVRVAFISGEEPAVGNKPPMVVAFGLVWFRQKQISVMLIYESMIETESMQFTETLKENSYKSAREIISSVRPVSAEKQ